MSSLSLKTSWLSDYDDKSILMPNRSRHYASSRARIVVDQDSGRPEWADSMNDLEDQLLNAENLPGHGVQQDGILAFKKNTKVDSSSLQLILDLDVDDTEESLPLEQPGSVQSKYLSTGTTIAGIVGRDFCVLGADTRATAGQMVADKEADKIHRLARNLYACGAGTSADLDHITRLAYYSFRLQAMEVESIGNQANTVSANEDFQIPVEQACRFLRNYLYDKGGSCQANLIVGGVYNGKAVLRAIHPHGSMDYLAFAALGSGGLAAMAVLESRYRPDLTVEEAILLVKDAIVAGIENDLGSGSQVDLCVISKDGNANHTRAFVAEEKLPSIPDEEKKFAASGALEEELSSQGVNGFGNVAFSIKSQRRINFATGSDQRSLWELLQK